ncbi:MAG: hypothetical protein ILO43_08510, partial [Clostridia bacterium]|nr:hypothetical protein [Clostridia bacterium]
MAEQTTAKKTNTKKVVIIAVSAILILALIAAAVILVVKNSGEKGPLDPNGKPLFPKTSDITSVEYLHRGGLEQKQFLAISEKELTGKENIEDFLHQLKQLELRSPTDKDRASIDYAADVEMFTLKGKDGQDDTLLLMGDSISISNENGNFFYMTDGFDVDELTANF